LIKTFKEFFENGLPAVLLLLAFLFRKQTVDLRELYYAGLPGVIFSFYYGDFFKFLQVIFTDRWVGGNRI
jgi:hypothetical protein